MSDSKIIRYNGESDKLIIQVQVDRGIDPLITDIPKAPEPKPGELNFSFFLEGFLEGLGKAEFAYKASVMGNSPWDLKLHPFFTFHPPLKPYSPIKPSEVSIFVGMVNFFEPTPKEFDPFEFLKPLLGKNESITGPSPVEICKKE